MAITITSLVLSLNIWSPMAMRPWFMVRIGSLTCNQLVPKHLRCTASLIKIWEFYRITNDTSFVKKVSASICQTSCLRADRLHILPRVSTNRSIPLLPQGQPRWPGLTPEVTQELPPVWSHRFTPDHRHSALSVRQFGPILLVFPSPNLYHCIYM